MRELLKILSVYHDASKIFCKIKNAGRKFLEPAAVSTNENGVGGMSSSFAGRMQLAGRIASAPGLKNSAGPCAMHMRLNMIASTQRTSHRRWNLLAMLRGSAGQFNGSSGWRGSGFPGHFLVVNHVVWSGQGADEVDRSGRLSGRSGRHPKDEGKYRTGRDDDLAVRIQITASPGCGSFASAQKGRGWFLGRKACWKQVLNR